VKSTLPKQTIKHADHVPDALKVCLLTKFDRLMGNLLADLKLPRHRPIVVISLYVIKTLLLGTGLLTTWQKIEWIKVSKISHVFLMKLHSLLPKKKERKKEKN
jgi:hypothetical protein